MPLHIGRVDTDLSITPTATSGSAQSVTTSQLRELSNAELRERLRPLVIQILEEELERFRHWQG